jgi:hypothetical protein
MFVAFEIFTIVGGGILLRNSPYLRIAALLPMFALGIWKAHVDTKLLKSSAPIHDAAKRDLAALWGLCITDACYMMWILAEKILANA